MWLIDVLSLDCHTNIDSNVETFYKLRVFGVHVWNNKNVCVQVRVKVQQKKSISVR